MFPAPKPAPTALLLIGQSSGDIPHGGWCPKGRKTEDGTIPGFVNAEGREVLTALQHRLRELGESTEIVIVK